MINEPINNLHDLVDQDHMQNWYEQTGRPFVTLSWAQTLDGCLTLNQGESVPISCQKSLDLTHFIRSQHDGILIGIGTALADNPRLTTRFSNGASSAASINGNGRAHAHPRPIVLDSQLRIPARLRLFDHPERPIIAVAAPTTDTQLAKYSQSADIIQLPPTAEGRVSLDALLDRLGALGIRHVMVEGGGRVLTSFLNASCANQAIITIAPIFAGGYNAVHPLKEKNWAELPRLQNVQTFPCGSDLIVTGFFAQPES